MFEVTLIGQLANSLLVGSAVDVDAMRTRTRQMPTVDSQPELAHAHTTESIEERLFSTADHRTPRH